MRVIWSRNIARKLRGLMPQFCSGLYTLALSVYVQMALVYEHKKGQILHSPDFQIHTVFLQSGRIL